MTSKMEWIPVTKRLPKASDGNKFLVTRKSPVDACVDVLYYGLLQFEKSNKKAFYFYDSEYGDVEVDDVIAWMPLPAPYDHSVSHIKQNHNFQKELEVLEILKDKLPHITTLRVMECEGTYDLYNSINCTSITNEEYELLKEWLNDK